MNLTCISHHISEQDAKPYIFDAYITRNITLDAQKRYTQEVYPFGGMYCEFTTPLTKNCVAIQSGHDIYAVLVKSEGISYGGEIVQTFTRGSSVCGFDDWLLNWATPDQLKEAGKSKALLPRNPPAAVTVSVPSTSYQQLLKEMSDEQERKKKAEIDASNKKQPYSSSIRLAISTLTMLVALSAASLY